MNKYFIFLLFLTFTCNAQVKIILRGLNNFEKNDISYVSEILRKNVDIPIFYKRPINVSKTDRIQTNDVQKIVKSGFFKQFNENKPITIFITRDKLRSKNMDVAGSCYGNEIYIQIKRSEKYITNTLIHELSHTFGLKHCPNKCLMSIDKKNYEITIFCNDCRKKLPKYFKK